MQPIKKILSEKKGAELRRLYYNKKGYKSCFVKLFARR
jgi:hypothetical protein